MSRGGADSSRVERRLRRSRRKKVVTPAVVQSSSSSETETGTEAEGYLGGLFEGDNYTDLAEEEFVIGETTEQRWEKMSRSESKDLGKGTTPEPGLADFMKLYIDDQRRRDERESKKWEAE